MNLSINADERSLILYALSFYSAAMHSGIGTADTICKVAALRERINKPVRMQRIEIDTSDLQLAVTPQGGAA